MARDKYPRDQIIPIKFLNTGIQTNVDPKVLSSPLIIENGIYNNIGALEKRDGLRDINLPASNDKHLAVHKGNLVTLGTNLNVKTSSNTWQQVGNSGNIWSIDSVSTLPLSDSWLTVRAEMAQAGSVTAVIYTTWNGTNYALKIDSFDSTTGVRLDSRSLGSPYALELYGKVIACNSKLWYYYFDHPGGTRRLKYGEINTSTGVIPAESERAASVITPATTRPEWDCCSFSNGSSKYVAIVYPQAASTDTIDVLVCTDGDPGSSSVGTDTHRVGVDVSGCACWEESDNRIGVAWYEEYNSEWEILGCVWNSTPAAEYTPILLESFTTTNNLVYNLTGYARTDGISSRCMWTRQGSSGVLYPEIHAQDFTDDEDGTGSLVGSTVEVHQNARIYGKPTHYGALNSGDVAYAVYTEKFDNSDEIQSQATITVVDASQGIPVARLFQGRCRQDVVSDNFNSSIGFVPSFQLVSGSLEFVCPFINYDDLSVSNRDIYCLGKVSITPDNPGQTCEANNLLVIGGGYPLAFDGADVYELGWPMYPENVGSSLTGSTGLADGDYKYRFVVEHIDGQGNILRSAPTPDAITVTVTGGPKNVVLTIPTTPLSRWPSATSNKARIVVYRTNVDEATPYHRIGHIGNNTTGTTVTYTDSTTTASGVETLYTGGGRLENVQPYPFDICATWDNRVFYVSSFEPNGKVYYSQPVEQYVGLEFNETLRIDLEDTQEPITAISSFLDKLIVFREHSIFAIGGTGGGYNSNGLGQNYNYWRLPAVIGAKNRLGVARIPQGILFESDDGIKLLSTGLTVEDIGEPVKYYTDNYTIKGVSVLPDEHRVVWLTDGPAIVYDYKYNSWTTFDSAYDAYSVATIDGVIWFSDPDNNKVKYTTTNEDDNLNSTQSYISMKVSTGWISLADIGGYQMLREILILGQNLDNHKLRVKIAYNYDHEWRYEKTFDSKDLEQFDSTAYFGAELGSDYRYGAYLLRVRPNVRRCTSFRLEISDEVSATAEYASGWSLTGLAIKAAILQGTHRIGTSRRL